jgi:hypothetical protein
MFKMDFRIQSRVIGQALSRGPLTAEERVRAQVSPCDIHGGRSGIGTKVSTNTPIFALSVSFHHCFLFTVIQMLLLPEVQTDEAWEHPKTQCTSGKRRALDRKALSLFFSGLKEDE